LSVFLSRRDTLQLINLSGFSTRSRDPSHNPFFSVENASALITSHGYQLYLQCTDSESSLWDPGKATVNQIWGYRNYVCWTLRSGSPMLILQ
jgi:hypothetical protein